jgi:hypothetical protein
MKKKSKSNSKISGFESKQSYIFDDGKMIIQTNAKFKPDDGSAVTLDELLLRMMTTD